MSQQCSFFAFIITYLTMFFLTFIFSVKITGRRIRKSVQTNCSLQLCHGLLCLSPSVNLTHLEQRRICCPLTKHRMSTGVNSWLISPNIMASSSNINCSTNLLLFASVDQRKNQTATVFFFQSESLCWNFLMKCWWGNCSNQNKVIC